MSNANNNESGIFKPGEEERICQTLKAYIEEWGPEAVIVKVPMHWKGYGSNTLGRVRLEYTTVNTVEVHVEYETVRLEYTTPIDKTLPT